jgi:hypothetical protein
MQLERQAREELAKLKVEQEKVRARFPDGETDPAVMRVVEWCFLNFRFYQMPEEERAELEALGELFHGNHDGELEVAYDPKSFLRFSIEYDFLCDHQLGGSEAEPSAVASARAIHSRRMKRLCTIHNNIADRVPSPFSEDELARLGIVPETDEDIQEGKRHRKWCRDMAEVAEECFRRRKVG